MAGSGVNQSYDDRLVSFYIEKLCLEADLVYRFAYTITLNNEAAFECVTETFNTVSKYVSELMPLENGELRLRLLSICLSAARKIGDKYAFDKSEFSKQLMKIDEKSRIALVLVDAGILTPAELTDLLTEDETSIRRYLARGRKDLLEHAN